MVDKDGNPTGLWRYTCRNDSQIWAVGFCAQGCPGHDSPEGAYEHQRQYLLSTVTYDLEYLNWLGCTACDAPTKKGARWAMESGAPFCDDHLKPEFVEPHVRAGNVISSF